MQIGEFSRRTDLTIDTLRYYEEEGLLHPIRTAGNRREYSNKDIEWVKFLKRLKHTGMSIHNMKHYAKLRYQGNSTIPERLHLLQDQEARLNTVIEDAETNLEFLHQKMKFYHDLQNNEYSDSTRK